jgi:uncharacterized Zn finger protein (UPF0148 family)
MNNPETNTAPRCPACGTDKTVEHNGGKWCPTCGIWVTPANPEIVKELQKHRETELEDRWADRQKHAEDTELQLHNEIDHLIDSVESLEQLPPVYVEKWRSAKRIMLIWGLVLLAVSPTLGYFLLHSAANSVDRSLDHLVQGHQEHPGDLGGNLGRGVSAVGNGIGFMMFLALAAGGVLLGLGFTIGSGISLLVGPPKAGKTPKKSIRAFFGNVLTSDSSLAGGKIYSERLPAFVCLSAKARQAAQGFERFCRYWSSVRSGFMGSKTVIHADVGNIFVKGISETISNYEVIIRCTTFTMVNGERSGSTTNDYETAGQIIRVGNRWYLTDAKEPVKKATKESQIGRIVR